MGTFQRDWADDLGKLICASYTATSIDNQAVSLAVETIQTRYPQATHIEWIGDGDYSSIGDIMVWQSDQRIAAIELKSSRSNGRGTSANVSQNFFGEWFDEGIGYTAWEKQDGIWGHRYRIVEQLTGTLPRNQTQYVNLCRELKDTGQLGEIVWRTNEKKSEYIQEIAPVIEADPQRMSLLLHILRQGKHTRDAIRQSLADSTITLPRSILIGQWLDTDPQWSWDEKASSPDDEIASVAYTDKGIVFRQCSGQEARFQLHWKNVAQGVKTPCFNIWY
jgi:hypothetical protein